MLGRIRMAAGAMIIVLLAGGTVSAAPLLPAIISTMSRTVPDAAPVRWRGHHGGGAGVAVGLAAGLIFGGLLAAPQYYDEPYPYYGYYTHRDTSGRSATARRAGRPIVSHAIALSILSVEHIWVVTVVGIIADSREFQPRRGASFRANGGSRYGENGPNERDEGAHRDSAAKDVG